jgi:hypothetical protein
VSVKDELRSRGGLLLRLRNLEVIPVKDRLLPRISPPSKSFFGEVALFPILHVWKKKKAHLNKDDEHGLIENITQVNMYKPIRQLTQ